MNKKVKRVITLVVAMVMAMSMLAGCGGSDDATGNATGNATDNATGNATASGEKVTITFWAAPNPTQMKFWSDMATAFQAQNSNITVEVSQMKETPSSEATIQTAIASQTAPTASENITRSFAAQLADSQALVPIGTLSGFEDIVSKRNMTNTVKAWEFSDGNQYVIPEYSNPMLFVWNLTYLKELGYDAPPETYSDLLAVTKAFKEKHPDKFLWAKPDLADDTPWMRWFDFFMLYNAASGGGDFVKNNQYAADENAVTEVLTLMSELVNLKALSTQQMTNPFETGITLMSDLGPWTFPNWAEQFPNLKYNENYVLSMPPVPDAMKGQQSHTYADAKGIVIYASATAAQQQAAMEFFDFVYGNEANDLNFMEVTNLIPARDDLATNAQFNDFFSQNPMLKPYAENVPFGVPSMDNANYNDIQQALGDAAWVPVIKGTKTPQQAVSALGPAISGVLK